MVRIVSRAMSALAYVFKLAEHLLEIISNSPSHIQYLLFKSSLNGLHCLQLTFSLNSALVIDYITWRLHRLQMCYLKCLGRKLFISNIVKSKYECVAQHVDLSSAPKFCAGALRIFGIWSSSASNFKKVSLEPCTWLPIQAAVCSKDNFYSAHLRFAIFFQKV